MNNFNSIKTIFYQFLIPIFFAFIFEICFNTIKPLLIFNLIENILFALLIISFCCFFDKIKTKRFLFFILIIFFNFFLIFETLYYYLFEAILSSSAIFILIESNNYEVTEFISSHIDIKIISYLILSISLTFYSVYKIFKTLEYNSGLKVNRFTLFEIILSIYFALKLSGFIIYNGPYIFLKTPLSYLSEINKFKVYGNENKIGTFTNLTTSNIQEDELFVIVIGESTNKKHFNLYGDYHRETNPLLNEIKNELSIFKNVISPHTYTIASLSKVLTLGNYENPEKMYQGSVLQLFNQADFQTYWISNQRPIGMMDTHITKIGMGANKYVFLNTKHTNDNTNLDNALLKPFNDAINDKGNKKVVFLHLLGTHMDYKMRYGKNDEYFIGTPSSEFNSEKAYSTINTYDNAVRYNDKLLREIIEIVKNQKMKSYVLFFSDHGQEVYDDANFFGHTIDQNTTKNMFEIPMFIWTSAKYNKNKVFNFNPEAKYMTDDLIHSIADISGVKCSEIDSTRSIFNENFKVRKRIILDSVDYDIFFK